MRVAVIAGTPVDTKMGVDFLAAKGVEAQGYPVAQTAQEQVMMQVGSQMEREEKVGLFLKEIKSQGINIVMIYCNSLSATIDVEKLAKEFKIHIITPMDAYGKIARQYKKLGVMAGSNQGLSGIEKTMMNASENMFVIGLASLPLAQEIEAGISPKELMETNGLKELIAFYEKNHVEAIVLGCTHFPYLMKELSACTAVPVIDPAEIIYEIIVKTEEGIL